MNKKAITVLAAAVLAAALCAGAVSAAAAGGRDASAPVAENLELETYRGVSVGGRLSAVDPDGGVLSYEITTNPVKGSVELLEDGQFIYTPKAGKKGRDYFGYKATDSDGNSSQEATVIIRIIKQSGSVTYSDLSGSASGRDAVALAESGVYVGACVGGEYVFAPEETVSRGEFLAMCMGLSDRSILSGVKSTGFADDSEIPLWVKPYVSTALMHGLITGYTDGDSAAVFCAEAPITWNEAAVMLDNVLDLSDVAYTAGVSAEDVPDWSYQATVNLAACDILDSPVSSMDENLSRADAARLLAGALDVLARR